MRSRIDSKRLLLESGGSNTIPGTAVPGSESARAREARRPRMDSNKLQLEMGGNNTLSEREVGSTARRPRMDSNKLLLKAGGKNTIKGSEVAKELLAAAAGARGSEPVVSPRNSRVQQLNAARDMKRKESWSESGRESGTEGRESETDSRREGGEEP